MHNDMVLMLISKYVCLLPGGFVFTSAYMPDMLNSNPAVDTTTPVNAKPVFMLSERADDILEF